MCGGGGGGGGHFFASWWPEMWALKCLPVQLWVICVLLRAIEVNPQSAKLMAQRAYFRMAYRNDTAAAVEDCITSIQLDPENALVHYNLGVMRYSLLAVDAALADYSEAINVDSQFVQAYNNRGIVFKDMAYYTAALDDYARAVALAPGEARPYFNRAVLRNQLKDYREAVEDLDRYIELVGNDTAARRKREIMVKRGGLGASN